GIDLILAQGMNVKVVLFPEGEDPDSYSKSVGITELEKYLNEKKQDFINFKAQILLKDSNKDPIQRAETIKDIVKSIGVIPDQIVRSVYIRETSHMFEIGEQALLNEVNKHLQAQEKKNSKNNTYTEPDQGYNPGPVDVPATFTKKQTKGKHELELQERDLIRLMIQYGAQTIDVTVQDDDGKEQEVSYPLSQYIIEELLSDELSIINESYQRIFDEFFEGLQQGLVVSDEHFMRHQDQDLSRTVIDISTPKDIVSENWTKRHGIRPGTELDRLKSAAQQSVAVYKLRVIENMITDQQDSLKLSQDISKLDTTLLKIKELMLMRNDFAEKLGIVVTR
ncbi:MAG: DNA primase, partial [Flavobacteriales bacterium]